MIRYIFCMTGCSHWAETAQKLYEKGVAEPVIWLGDDRHYEWARGYFGNAVLRMNDHVHYPVDTSGLSKFKINDHGFFGSDDYLRAKDRCLKMMDRLDDLGMFSRLDREIFFNNLCLIFISNIEQYSPTHIVMTEAPHSHAQYLLYEISLYFGLNIAWFNRWEIGPVMCLQNMRTQQYIPTSEHYTKNIPTHYVALIDTFISNVELKWNGEFEYDYMIAQKQGLRLLNRFSTFIKYSISRVIRQSLRNVRNRISKTYNPINPFYLNFLIRESVRKRRYRALRKSCSRAAATEVGLSEQRFVYFALHFEPERTTNPDGGVYHDQFIAIQKLRQSLPDDIHILVKEHPSQYYMRERGPKGRSPLFYSLLNSLAGVSLVDTETESIYLQRNCEFVATITGSVAIESAIMGKPAVIFGDAWFRGCPNVFFWDDVTSIKEVLTAACRSSGAIRSYLVDLFNYQCIVANQNRSAQGRNSSFISGEFNALELKGGEELIGRFLLEH